MPIDPITDKIMCTWYILEAADPAEYVALSDANKALFAIIVSAGVVNFVPESNVVNVLFAMFPSGTTTYTNLHKLLP